MSIAIKSAPNVHWKLLARTHRICRLVSARYSRIMEQKISHHVRTPSLFESIGHLEDALCQTFGVIELVDGEPLARKGQIYSLRTN